MPDGSELQTVEAATLKPRDAKVVPTWESKWVDSFNSTSAQLGYTAPFTLVHAGKYRTAHKLKTETLQN